MTTKYFSFYCVVYALFTLQKRVPLMHRTCETTEPYATDNSINPILDHSSSIWSAKSPES